MQRYTIEFSRKSRTFVPNNETKIETTNTGGKVLAFDGEELVGALTIPMPSIRGWALAVHLSVLPMIMPSIKG